MLSAGCGRSVPSGALVVVERPAITANSTPLGNVLDQRYPAGTRIVLIAPPFQSAQAKILSGGLIAAGEVVVCPAGDCAVFSGKAEASGPWQIYRADVHGRRLQRMTDMPGGAMHPTFIANHELVYCSPVPKPTDACSTAHISDLYAQAPGGQPRRLTFGTSSAFEPTAMQDGRILFVSALPSRKGCENKPDFALFTINNDGTELTPFALDHDGAPLIRRPRELPDGRVTFLAATHEAPDQCRAETVRKARPFATRAPLSTAIISRTTSVARDREGRFLVCAEISKAGRSTAALFRLGPDDKALSEPLFLDPSWDIVEAESVSSSIAPMGHMSAIMAGKNIGTVLCLNANFIRPTTNGTTAVRAERVRVLTTDAGAGVRLLGEVPLQADGSFMAEVPADIPLGFESVDAQGQVVQYLPPTVWVRPAENRSCIGCHEPFNRSPRNIRPLAATLPPAACFEQKPVHSVSQR
jgi:hypothetical protein